MKPRKRAYRAVATRSRRRSVKPPSRTAGFRPHRADGAGRDVAFPSASPRVTPKRPGVRGSHRNTRPTPPGALTTRRSNENLGHPSQDPLPMIQTKTTRGPTPLPIPCPTWDMESGEALGPRNVFRSGIWTVCGPRRRGFRFSAPHDENQWGTRASPWHPCRFPNVPGESTPKHRERRGPPKRPMAHS